MNRDINRGMERFLTAINNNDLATVHKLIARDPRLAAFSFDKPKLYDGKIFHWIYVGDTALHLAAAGYRVQIVRELLAAGADPNASNNHRRSSPLHYAADGYINGAGWDPKSQVATIRVLLEAGADINAQDKNGATPLHRAVRTRCAAAVKHLLQAGANPRLKNKPGSTAFHLAVQNTGRGGTGASAAISEQRDIIEQLLLFGLTPDLKSASGKTVRDSAPSDWIKELLSKPMGRASKK